MCLLHLNAGFICIVLIIFTHGGITIFIYVKVLNTLSLSRQICKSKSTWKT